jgi:hypothetical protein
MVSSCFGGMTDKKEDVYYEYLNIVTGSTFDATTIKWRLASSATPEEFQLWESYIDSGFERCKAFDSNFGGHTKFVLAYRHVDEVVASWWREDMIANDIVG